MIALYRESMRKMIHDEPELSMLVMFQIARTMNLRSSGDPSLGNPPECRAGRDRRLLLCADRRVDALIDGIRGALGQSEPKGVHP